MIKRAASLVAFLLLFATLLKGDVPRQIPHQGRVAVKGANFTGTGNFKFLLFTDLDDDHANGNESARWANNQTSPAAMGEPAVQVKLDVENGHYGLMLGDTALHNMEALPGNLDPGPSRHLYLRTWFSDSSGPFEQLSPDLRIGSAPFALLARHTTGGLAAPLDANKFDLVDIGALGIGTSSPSELLHLSSDSHARILLEADRGNTTDDHAQILFRENGGAVGMTLGFSADLGSNVFGFSRRAGGNDHPDTLVIEALTGNVGIGTIDPNAPLDVASVSSPVIRAESSSLSESTVRASLNAVHRTIGDMQDGFGSSTVFSIEDNADVRRNIGALGAIRDGADTTGKLVFQPYSGEVPRTLMTLDADGDLALLDSGGLTEFTLRANDYSGGPWFAMYGEGIADPSTATASDRSVEIRGDEGAGGSNLLMRNSTGKTTVELDASEGTDDASFSLWDGSSPSATFFVNSHDGTFGGAYLAMRRENNIRTIELDAAEDDGDAVIRLWGSNGTGSNNDAAIILDSDIGGGSRITVDVLELRGADLSENFNVAPADHAQEVLPGMVVSIDPDRPGELTVSQRPYDTRVAGVVSGADGIRTGIVMRQPGSIADGAHQVAMTGRVWVEATSENGPITPGDLLTTSSVAGHAMRADDPAKSFGAVLGKAMTPLHESEGKVLALVNLQ